MILTESLADDRIKRDVPNAKLILETLTEGQCEVLDLLLAGYETNKEIAFKLDISPSTVAQRIGLAGVKLRTKGRGQTKREYERLRRECAFPVYQSQHIPICEVDRQHPPQVRKAPASLLLSDAVSINRIAPWADRFAAPTGLEAFVEKLNALSVSTIIVCQAVLLTILAITMLAILGIFFEFDFLRFVT